MVLEDKSICIVGLGFVGLTLAVVLAKKGFNVHGIEKNKEILNSLKKKKSHFYEPDLNKILKEIIKKKKFTFSKNITNNNNSVYIVTVGTPLNNKKKIITSFIKKTTNEIKKVIKNNDLVILRSTVKIGTTRELVFPLLNKKKIKFSLSYCPERAVEGSALKELEYLPQIIGGIDKNSIIRSKKIFSKMTNKTIETSNVETAEMIKLIDNSSRDVFFAYANEIARICDKIGINANEVINSGKLKYDRTDIARPGLVGGPCLHKDPYIFSESVKKKGIKAEITLTARNINERQPYEIVRFLKKLIIKNNFRKKLNILFLGMAFKGHPVTDDLRGSMGIKVFQETKRQFKNSNFYGYDPVVSNNKLKKIGLKVETNLNKAFKNKDLVLILNDHKEFSKMDIPILSKKLNSPSIIYDVWNLFNNSNLKLNKHKKYISLGAHINSN